MSTATATTTTQAASRPAARPTGRLHLTRRGRAVFTTLAAVPLVAGALVFALNGGIAFAADQGANHAAGQVHAAPFSYVTIQPGQSLWQLAQAIAPTEDPRDVIAEIVSLNRLASEDVQPGQRLAILPRSENG